MAITKNKTLKRIVSMVLIICMMFSIAPNVLPKAKAAVGITLHYTPYENTCLIEGSINSLIDGKAPSSMVISVNPNSTYGITGSSGPCSTIDGYTKIRHYVDLPSGSATNINVLGFDSNGTMQWGSGSLYIATYAKKPNLNSAYISGSYLVLNTVFKSYAKGECGIYFTGKDRDGTNRVNQRMMSIDDKIPKPNLEKQFLVTGATSTLYPASTIQVMTGITDQFNRTYSSNTMSITTPPAMATNIYLSDATAIAQKYQWAAIPGDDFQIIANVYGKFGSSSTTKTYQLDKSTTSYWVNGLEPGQQYRFWLTTKNSVAEFNASDFYNNTLAVGSPSDFQTCSPTNARSVYLAWTALSNETNVLDKYIIYRSLNGGQYEKIGETSRGTLNYTDNTVIPSTQGINNTYTYRIFGKMGTFESTTYKQKSVTMPKISVPATPTISDVTPRSLRLNWTSPGADIVKYNIYRSKDGGTYQKIQSNYTGLSYNDTDLEPSTQSKGVVYRYKITGVNSSGLESQDSGIATRTMPTIGVPIVGGVPQSDITTNSIRVHWSNPGNVTYYKVYRGTSPSSINELIHTTSDATTTAYINTGLNNATKYYYRVDGIYTYSGTDYTSQISNTVEVTTKPVAPTELAYNNSKATSIGLSWTAPGSAVNGYNVYYKTGTDDFAKANTSLITDTNYTVTGLTNNTLYKFYVVAETDGGEGVASGEIAARTLLPTMSAPTLTVNDDSTEMNVSWASVTDATNYNVYYSTNESGTYTAIPQSMISGTSAVVTGLEPNTQYYFKVTAFNSFVESEKSNYTFKKTMTAKPAVTVTATSTTEMNVSWNAHNGADKYRLYYTADPNNLSSFTQYGGDITGTSFDVTGLTAGKNYRFKVCGVNLSGEGEMSDIITKPTKPNAPIALASVLDDAGNIKLTWEEPTGQIISGYKIYRGTSEGSIDTLVNSELLPKGTTTFTNDKLTQNTTYYYQVVAVNDGGESERSTTTSKTTPDLSIPEAPTLEPISKSSIKLTWPTATGASGYKIYRSKTSGGATKSTTAIAEVDQVVGQAPTYTDTGLDPGTTYYYAITSVSGGTETVEGPEAGKLTMPNEPSITVKANKFGELDISWDPVKSATKYYINYGTDSLAGASLPSITGTSYTHTVSSPNTTYYYKVRAYNSSGYSEFSTVKSTKTLCDAPSTLTPTKLSPTSIKLDWGAVTGASGYTIKRGPSQDDLTKIGDGYKTPTTFTDEGLVGATTYYYGVFTENSSGVSDKGKIIQVSTQTDTPTNLETEATETSITATWDIPPSGNKPTAYELYYRKEGYTTTFVTVPAPSDPSATTVSHTITGLSGQEYYYLKVKAKNDAKFGDSAETAEVKRMLALPAPIGVLATVNGSEGISLEWEPVEGATFSHYVVKRGLVQGVFDEVLADNLTATQFTDTTVKGGTKYYYAVYSVNTGGTYSAPSVEAATTKMGTPTNITITNVTKTSMDVTWDKVNSTLDIDRYVVMYGTDPTMSTRKIQILRYPDVNQSQYTVSLADLSAGTEYYVSIYAYNSTLGKSAESDPQAVITTCEKPEISAETVSSKEIKITWNDDPAKPKLKIYRGTSSSAIDELIAAGVDTAVKTEFIDKDGLESGTTYYYKAIAFKDDLTKGIKSADSEVSSVISKATLLGAPTNFKVEQVDPAQPRSVKISWTAPQTGDIPVAKYKCYRRVLNGESYSDEVTGTSYTVTTVVEGSDYTFYVVALDGSGNEGDKSEVISATMTTETPTSFTAEVLNDNEIKLDWSSVLGAAKYLVYQTDADGSTYLSTPEEVTGTSHTFTGLDSGSVYKFKVVVVNKSDWESAPTETTATTKMKAPTNVAVALEGTDGNKAKVTWTAPQTGSKAISGYDVYYGTDPDNLTDKVTVSESEAETTISGLDYIAKYYFYVKTLSADNGESDKSETVSLNTLCFAPTPKPIAQSATEVKITWSSVPGAASYTLKRGTTLGNYDTTLASDLEDYEYVDTGLVGGTTYYYALYAKNDDGISAPGEKGVTTLLGAPTDVTADNATTDSFDVSFVAPVSGSAIDSYEVSYEAVDKTETVKTVSTADTSVTLTGLTAGKEYEVTVRAKNLALGLGDVSEKIIYAAKPSSPTVTAQTESGKAINLSFTEVSGATGYTIKRGTQLGVYDTTVTENCTDLTFTDNTGLISATTYYYAVYAENISGLGIPGTANAMTYLAAPNAYATSDDTTSIRVVWDELESGIPIDTYYIYYKEDIDSEYQSVTSKSLNETISGLLPGTTYNVYMQAYASGYPDSSHQFGDTTEVIDVNTVPEPTVAVIESYTGSTVTLNWNKVSGATGYKIMRGTEPNKFTVTVQESIDATTYTDEDLIGGTKYYYSVAAINKSGIAEPSYVDVTTKFGKPINVTTEQISDTSARVSWVAPATGTTIEGYTLYYGTESGVYTENIPTTKTSLLLENLTEKGTYFVSIKANNASLGEGDESEETIISLLKLVTGVTLDKTDIELSGVGSTESLIPTISPEDATDKSVYYVSSDTNVVTVSEDGVVTATGEGDATVTVVTNNLGKTAKCNVTVSLAVKGMKFDKNSADLYAGDDFTINPIFSPADAKDKGIVWTSSSEEIATVSDGVVTALKEGTATIKGVTNDGSFEDTCIVKIIQGVESVSLNASSLTLYVGEATTQLKATITPDNATIKDVYFISSDTDIVTVSDTGVVTAVAPGEAKVTVRTADRDKTAECQVTSIQKDTAVVLNKHLLEFNESGQSETLVATVEPENASDKTVTWSSDNESVAIVDATGKVTAMATGTANITATTVWGHTDTCKVDIFLRVLGVKLNKTSSVLNVSRTETLTATIIPEGAYDKSVTWSSSNPDVAIVDQNGVVTGVASGTAQIDVVTTDGGHRASCVFIVSQLDTGVTLDKSTLTLDLNTTEQLTATVEPEDAINKEVTWTSSDPLVATVDETGIVTAKRVGETTVTVKTVSGYTATCLVKVVSVVTGVELDKETLEIVGVGKSEPIIAMVKPSSATNKNVSWSSSNPDVAVVDGHGVVTAKKSGTTTITVETEEGHYTATCEVNVKVPVTAVTLNKAATTLTGIGATETLTYKVSPDGVTDGSVTWESSNPSVATVDGNGKITAVADGTADITVETVDGGFTATCNVRVIDVVTGITIDKSEMSIYTAESDTLIVNVLPETASNKMVKWTTSNSTVAAVSNDGEVTGILPGTAIITATTEDGGYEATCEVTVKQVVTGISLNKTDLAISGTGTTVNLKATVTPSNATDKSVYWTSSDTNVVTVNQNGAVTSVGEGTATITARANFGTNIEAECAVTVTLPAEGVTLNRIEADLLKLGSEYPTIQLTETVYPLTAENKNVFWDSDNTGVATVSGNGLVTGIGTGTAIIKVMTEQGGYQATCKINVRVAVTDVSFEKTAVTIEGIGNTATLNYTVTPEAATDSSVTFTSDNMSVATVDENGVVTAVDSGTARITVTTVDGEYEATCDVTVNESVSAVELNKEQTTLTGAGASEKLTATVTPTAATNKAVTWSSSNEDVVTVNSSGVITAVTSGSATITVTTVDGSYTDTCEVTVIIPVKGVYLNKTTVKFTDAGMSDILTATVIPFDATNKAVTWSSSNEGVVTVDQEGYIEAVDGGVADIIATTEDGSYFAKCEVTVTIPVEKILLDNENLFFEDAEIPQQLRATVVPENATDKLVVWDTSNEEVAVVDNTGKVTAIANGTVLITAKTLDGKVSATCTVTVALIKRGISLNKTSINLLVGQSDALLAFSEPAHVLTTSVVWSSDKPEIAKVSGDGLITAISAGEATITVSSVDGKYWTECKVTVSDAVTGVELDRTVVPIIGLGEKVQLNATVLPLTAVNRGVTWKSSNKAVAMIDTLSGEITSVGPGAATITVTTDEGGFKATCQVYVTSVPQYIVLDKTDIVIRGLNKEAQLEATIIPENAADATVTWTSSNEEVATVDETGKITSIAKGTAVIKARTNIGNCIATCNVTVEIPTTEIIINPSTLKLTSIGANSQLEVLSNPEGSQVKSIKWTSSNEAVAIVDSVTGIVTAAKVGTATITATDEEGHTAECVVTVVNGVTDITLSDETVTMDSYSTYTINAVINPSNATDPSLKWESSNPKVAHVSDSGVITSYAAGRTTILVTSNDNPTVYKECVLTVIQPVTSLFLDKTNIKLIERGQTETLKAIIGPKNATHDPVVWTNTNDFVAKVDQNGVVTAVGNGITIVSASVSGYTVKCIVTVAITSKYQVSYLENEATSGTVPEASKHTKGTQVTVSSNIGNLEKTGFVFQGWNTEPDGSGLFYKENSTFIMGGADVNLYAQWIVEAAPTVVIEFVENGGNEISDIEAEDGTVITAFAKPVKIGHIFDKWYSDSDTTQAISTPYTVNGNATLYAKWIKIGDVNKDDKVSAVDARMVLLYLAGMVDLTPEQKILADIDGDNRITPRDAKIIIDMEADLDY